MFKFLLRSVILVIALVYPGSSQEIIKNRVIVYLSNIALESADSIAEETYVASFKSKRLNDFLNQQSIRKIRKAFPAFRDKDTTRMSYTGETVKIPNFSRYLTFEFSNNQNVDLLIEDLKKIPGVLLVEKDHDNVARLHGDPDLQNGYLWFFNNDGSLYYPQHNVSTDPNCLPGECEPVVPTYTSTVDADIDATDVWQIWEGNQSNPVKVGVIDSGVDFGHEELAGKGFGDGRQSIAHGTAVAGLIAAKVDNNQGGRGIDKYATIVSKKIFDGSDYISHSHTANKIIEAVDAGALVINHSWGGTFSATVQQAMAYAYKLGRTSVVAIGNAYDFCGSQVFYPAAYGHGVIVVGGSSHRDRKALYSQAQSYIDIAAPGGESDYNCVYKNFSVCGCQDDPRAETDPRNIRVPTIPGRYLFWWGTSFASPLAAGVASLLKGYNNALDHDDIENILKLSADKVGVLPYDALGWNFEMGYGRLNAKKAVDFLRPPYVLQRLNASGGTDMGAGPLVDVVIMGASGLSDGNYRVKRHEVRKTVFFNATNPKVWGRGVGTTGWESSPNFSMPFCEVVPGTATLNSAVVRTYVYEVYNSNGGPLCQVNCDDPPVFLGWYPASPANVTFAYTVLGTPSPVSVSISSPFCVSGKCQGPLIFPTQRPVRAIYIPQVMAV